MKPIILDTNILLDIFVFGDVRADRLRNAVLNRQIKTYSNQTSVEELRDVISRPLFALEEGRQAEIMGQWQSLSQSIEDLKLEAAPWKCQDPDDQVFLDLAFTVRRAVCGHEWVKRDGAEDPARCPNHKCRSTKWRGKQEANEPIED